MFKSNWVVFVVYKNYPNRNELKTVTLTFSGVTKSKAVELAEEEVCFSKDDGVDYRSVLLVKPVKARAWA